MSLLAIKSGIGLAVIDLPTLLADPVSVVELNILQGKRMPTLAMSFGEVFGSLSLFTTKEIFPLGHSLQMFRVYTRGFTAEMIDGHSFRYGTLKCHVGEAMSENVLMFHREHPIPGVIPISLPDPATVNAPDLILESP